MKKLALGLVLCLSFTPAAFAQDCTSKLQGFIDHSGYQVRVLKPCQSWILTDVQTVPRSDGLTGMLLIGTSDEAIVIGTVVRTKSKLDLSADLWRKMLQLNHEIQWVKIGIDHDGDLFVREEFHTERLTADDFNNAIVDVANASKEIAAALDEKPSSGN